MHSWISLWIGAEMVSFNFKKISYITIASTCLDPSPRLHLWRDPFGFHLTLQRDPGGSQRLAAALWMSPHSTLCGDEIFGERLEFVVPLMKMGEESEAVLNSSVHVVAERRKWAHKLWRRRLIIACKREDIIVELYLVRMPASFNYRHNDPLFGEGTWRVR